MKRRSPILDRAFKEVFSKVPRTVKASGKTGAAKRKMMQAIAFSKSRRAGGPG